MRFVHISSLRFLGLFKVAGGAYSGKEQTRCLECAREEELMSDCWGPVETSLAPGVVLPSPYSGPFTRMLSFQGGRFDSLSVTYGESEGD